MASVSETFAAPYGSASVRLYHADCLTVLPDISGARLVMADPPYNVSKEGGRNGFKGKKFLNDEWDTIEDYGGWSKEWMNACRASMLDNATMYVWGYHRSFPAMPISEWYQLNLLVWRKRNAFPTTMQNSIWSPSCEFAYWLRKSPGKDHVFHIGKDDFARDFFDEPVVTNRRHPCEKPEKIITEMVRRSSNENETVIDPFMGSGTTGIACIRTGRSFIGIEKDPRHYATAEARIRRELQQGVLFETQND